MTRFISVAGLLCVFACAADKPIMEAEGPAQVELAAKYQDYLEWNEEHTRPLDGWVNTSFDATLFTGLRCTYAPVDLSQAEEQPGRWHRRDLSHKARWNDINPQTGQTYSKSQISRDMLLGVAWCAWAREDSDMACRVLDYADANDNVMGPGDPSRTIISKDLKDTFRVICGTLRAEDAPAVNVSGIEQGYERHLAALHLLLRSDMTGKVSTLQKSWAGLAAKSQAHNPLYALLDARLNTGDYSETERLLLDDKYWPHWRLPDSSDYCDEWIVQRDMGPDWKPCSGKVEKWGGGDWLFIARFLVYP